MKKTTLLMILSIVMALTLSLGSTLAYLTAEDADVNIMTMGNIKIEQLEYERKTDSNTGDYVGDNSNEDEDDFLLQDYTQNKPMLPGVYQDNPAKSDEVDFSEIGVDYKAELHDKDDDVRNIQDKMVVVKNTGLNDAWVRTVVAYEYPLTLPGDNAPELLHTVVNYTDYTAETGFYTTIGGVRYWVETYIYNKKLTKGATTEPSLMQVYLDKKVNSDQAALFGDTMEILVVSQAVQADGFDAAAAALDEAFYDVDTNNHPWTEGTGISIIADTNWYKANPDATTFVVTTAEDLAGLAKLVNEGNDFADKTIKLSKDVDLKNNPWMPIGTEDHPFRGTFDGNSKTISNLLVNNTDYSGLFGSVVSSTIKNVKIDGFNVKSTHYAGAVVGHAAWSTVESCYVSNGIATCTDTTPAVGESNHGNIANGDKAGAVVGYIESNGEPTKGKATLINNTADKCTVLANRDAGQIVGCVSNVNNLDTIVSGNTATDVTVAWNGHGVPNNNITNGIVGRGPQQ